MSSAVYLTGSAVAIVVFILCFLQAQEENHLLLYITASIYGIILEKAAIIALQIYTYPADEFFLSFFGIPMSIGLAWAAIIYAGYITAIKLGLDTQFVPVFTALYVLHVDIAIDAIAIRIPFWSWVIPGAWFGVPLINFLAWYLVALLFTGTYIVLKDRISHPLLLGGSLIFVSTTLLLLLLELWQFITADLLYRQIAILGAIIGFSLLHLIYFARIDPPESGVYLWKPFFAILSIHLFYLSVLFIYQFYQEIPALLVISLSMIVLSVVVHFLPDAISIKRRLSRTLQ